METKKYKHFIGFKWEQNEDLFSCFFLAQEIQLWSGINDACDS